MFWLLILLVIIYSVKREKFLEGCMNTLMNIVHRCETGKREAIIFLHKNNLL